MWLVSYHHVWCHGFYTASGFLTVKGPSTLQAALSLLAGRVRIAPVWSR